MTEAAQIDFLPSPLAARQLSLSGSPLVPDAFTGYLVTGSLEPGPYREAAAERNTPEGLKRSVRYLASASEFLLPVLAERLDTVHGLPLGVEFWRRALGMSLERHLNLAWDLFAAAEEATLLPGLRAATLAPDCFHVPVDSDDLHWFLSDQDFGQEQLFSIYCNHFHPGRFPGYRASYRSAYRPTSPTPATPHQPVVGVLGSWFKGEWFAELVRRSGYQIQRIGYDRDFRFDAPFDREKRAFLAQPIPGADRFTSFFMATLNTLMPRVFVEEWRPVYGSLKAQLSMYRRLKYVVSELFIGDAIEPIAIAILRQQGVKLIYHEHNYTEHAFVASAAPRWARLCDLYLAHGPHHAELPNGAEGGSLFDFGPEREQGSPCRHDILYVSGLAFLKDSLLSGSAALAGNGCHAVADLRFRRDFLEAAGPSLRRRIHYRGYPRSGYGSNWQNCLEDIDVMAGLFDEGTRDDLSGSCKEAMLASRLVVIPYLATSHLESLTMNVPTILLFPAGLEFLAPGCRDYFNQLIGVGICQTDPAAAADFLGKVADDPGAWWYSPMVQRARRSFLAKAVGDPMKSIDLLAGLALGQTHLI